MAIPNIQRFFVPRRPSKKYGGVEVAHLWRPLKEIGGDFLYYDWLDSRYLAVEIGDVIGHDVHSGLVMTALHGLLFGLRQSLAPLNDILTHANRFLCRLQDLGENREADGRVHRLLTSMFLMRVDYERRSIAYCNAGHPYPLFLPSGATMHLKTGGPILGSSPDAVYEPPATLRPVAGDIVLMWTDGVSEATNDGEEQFGSDRLESILRALRAEQPRIIVEKLDAAVGEFRQTTPAEDDVAMALVQFNQKW